MLRSRPKLGLILAGLAAGAVNGLFGAGGGMVLVPLLTAWTALDDEEIFPASLSIILPICVVSLTFGALNGVFALRESIPYLIGSAAGGVMAGLLGKRIPTVWLHRGLGLLIIWGGVRYLC